MWRGRWQGVFQLAAGSVFPQSGNQFMKSHFLPVVSLAAICCQSPVSAEPGKLPEAGLKLEGEYEKALNAAQVPIRDQYVASLKQLYEESIRAGKPEDAIALKTEINRITAISMLGRWTDRIGKGIMDLRPDRLVTNTNGAAGHWEIREETLFVIWDNGWRQELPIVKTGTTLRGRVIDPSGKSQAFIGDR